MKYMYGREYNIDELIILLIFNAMLPHKHSHVCLWSSQSKKLEEAYNVVHKQFIPFS